MNNKLTFANFNCTFGGKEEPMLNYFDSIVYPAFNSKYIRKVSEDCSYLFDEIKLLEYEKDKFILYGFFIKRTNLEVKSLYDENSGIIKANNKYPSAPYSTFIIFLNNHRMVLVKNQKGSPDLKNFSATAKDAMKSYVRSYNKENLNSKLPYPKLNVVSMPSLKSIAEKLGEVKTIQKLTFRFYPLNGDIGIQSAFDSFYSELDNLGSKTANININSPKNIPKVVDLIASTKGTAEPKLDVTYKHGGTGTIESNSFSESVPIDLNETATLDNNISEIVKHTNTFSDIIECSEENQRTYNENLEKLKGIKNI